MLDHSIDTFSGEICRWTNETDDVSQIPERHADQAERIELQQETLKEVEKTGQPEEGTDRVKEHPLYQLFRDPKTGKRITVASPFYEEKERLKAKIDAIWAETKLFKSKFTNE